MGNNHNLWGVIAANNAYNSKYGISFTIPPKLALTEKNITTDATRGTIQDAVAEHAAKRNNRAIYEAVNKVCVAFIKAAVDKMW